MFSFLFVEMQNWENHREMLDTVMITLPFKQYNATLYEFEKRINQKLISIIKTLYDNHLVDLYTLMSK